MRKKYHVSPNIPRCHPPDNAGFAAGCAAAAFIALVATVSGIIGVWIASW
jgi:GT2 family glycosyltransferase